MKFLNYDVITTSIPGLVLSLIAVLVNPVGNVWAQASIPDGLATSMPSEPVISTNATNITSMSNLSGTDTTGATLPSEAGGTSDEQQPRMEQSENAPEDICDDGKDNDGDGPIDFDDADCGGKEEPPGGNEGDNDQAANEPSKDPEEKGECPPGTIYDWKTGACLPE